MGFSDGVFFRRRKYMCMPNFDEIFQSTAEIKLLPFSEKGRPLYGNFTSRFDFDLCVVIGKPFCICLPNFVVIGRSSAELWRYIHFFKIAAGSHIGFDLANVQLLVSARSSNLALIRFIVFEILRFLYFAVLVEIAYSRPCLRVFGGILPQI